MLVRKSPKNTTHHSNPPHATMALRCVSIRSVLLVVTIATAACFAAFPYEPQTAMSSLHYAKAAYCGKSKLATWTCPSCALHPHFQIKSVYDNGTFETQSYTGFNPDTNQVVVAYRGSDNLPNWIADFDFGFTPYPDSNCTGCQVHTGFLQVYLETAVDTLNDVRSLLQEHPTASVLVTGHSLGAAVSVHSALDIARKITNKVEVYNFGEPRLGNPAFAAWAASVLPDGKQYRLTHAADPVPHLPPVIFGFLHTPHELWYNNNGNTSFVHCNDSATAEDPNCSDSTIPIDFADHSLYLGICTGCNCDAAFEAKVEAMRQLVMVLPKTRDGKIRLIPKSQLKRA